jgi:hypothetical protein
MEVQQVTSDKRRVRKRKRLPIFLTLSPSSAVLRGLKMGTAIGLGTSHVYRCNKADKAYARSLAPVRWTRRLVVGEVSKEKPDNRDQ